MWIKLSLKIQLWWSLRTAPYKPRTSVGVTCQLRLLRHLEKQRQGVVDDAQQSGLGPLGSLEGHWWRTYRIQLLQDLLPQRRWKSLPPLLGEVRQSNDPQRRNCKLNATDDWAHRRSSETENFDGLGRTNRLLASRVLWIRRVCTEGKRWSPSVGSSSIFCSRTTVSAFTTLSMFQKLLDSSELTSCEMFWAPQRCRDVHVRGHTGLSPEFVVREIIHDFIHSFTPELLLAPGWSELSMSEQQQHILLLYYFWIVIRDFIVFINILLCSLFPQFSDDS